MSFDLTSKVALITGGAGLLGQQHAVALLKNNATIVLTDINDEALAVAKEKLSEDFDLAKIMTFKMDVSSKASIERTFDQLKSDHHSIDILVNNAAIDPKVKEGEGLIEASRFENFSVDQWDFQLDVGLKGAFLCSQVFGRAMAEKKQGVILNIASDLSVIAPDQRLYKKPNLPEEQQPVKPVTYSVIKTALLGLTRYLAAYWADKNVRVNALSPGGVYVNQPEEFVAKLSSLIPMGRMAAMDEYHQAIQFLCSDASSYMTGQNMVMDGGRSII